MIKQNASNSGNQSGIAMVTALLLLLAITLVGVTSFRMNIADEVMAGNSYLRAQAEQAAEATLRAAEGQIFAAAGTEFSFDKLVANNRTAADTCTAGNGGICSPMRHSLTFNPDNPQFERWIDANDGRSLNVWSTNERNQELAQDASDAFNLSVRPQYIVEFLGYTPASTGPDGSACGREVFDRDVWPYCQYDRKMYRITALAQAGSARVMLQSVFITP